MEGVADNVECTKWCNQISQRLSIDGTSEYIASIAAFDPRIHVLQKSKWNGKIEMANAPLKHLDQTCLLWMIDADEIWRAEQIEKMAEMFAADPSRNSAFFRCNYWVGRDLLITSKNTYGNQESGEWHRVWKVSPGNKFAAHEPPIMADFKLHPFAHDETELAGLRFEHYAYVTEAQVRFKQKFYGRESGDYRNAVVEWKKLQAASGTRFLLRDYLSWIKDEAVAERQL